MFDKKFIEPLFFLRYIKSIGKYNRFLNYVNEDMNNETKKIVKRYSNDIIPHNLFYYLLKYNLLGNITEEKNGIKLLNHVHRFDKYAKQRYDKFKESFIIIKNEREYVKLEKYFYGNGLLCSSANNKYQLERSYFFHYHLFKINAIDDDYNKLYLSYYHSAFSLKDFNCYIENRTCYKNYNMFIDDYEKFKKKIWFKNLNIIDKIKHIYNKIKKQEN